MHKHQRTIKRPADLAGTGLHTGVTTTLRFLPAPPNTGVVFIKTFNSWHSVRPMRAPGQENMRKNIIINITSN